MSKISNWVFNNVHNNNLIYNTCWEDPRCDRQLLQLNKSSEVVMITSAGCNALDYALDNPFSINCIDMNHRQNALLQLKMASIQNTAFNDLFNIFGKGVYKNVNAIYKDVLSKNMPEFARQYWDKNIKLFRGNGIRKSFYWHSTSGSFAWLLLKYMQFKKSNRITLDKLFASRNMTEQRENYFRLERGIINDFIKWVMDLPIIMTMLGVPASQHKMVSKDDSAMGYIISCLRHVFAELPIQDNYFYYLYFTGRYDTFCAPNYLKKENFETLKENSRAISTHTTTLTSFLKENPKPYSHFVLLDHQDWLAANDVPALNEEWKTILDNSQSGTRIVLRSAAKEINFFPTFVNKRIEFEKELTAITHKQDRVGTYASVYLGIVK